MPVNIRFEVDDIEAEWTYPTTFDLIHSRFLAGSIEDWHKLVSQTYKSVVLTSPQKLVLLAGGANMLRHIKPGGWCEFKDWDVTPVSPDNSLPENSEMVKFIDLIISACSKIGREPRPGHQVKKWLEDAGFVNVKEVVKFVPIGLWPKDAKQVQAYILPHAICFSIYPQGFIVY